MYCSELVSTVRIYLTFEFNCDGCLCDRCDAHWNNLDGGGGRRSHELTEALSKALGTKALWDDYGIIDGVMVCTSFALFLEDYHPSLCVPHI